MKRSKAMILAIVLAVLGAGAVVLARNGKEPTNFSGTWRLDAARSDIPRWGEVREWRGRRRPERRSRERVDSLHAGGRSGERLQGGFRAGRLPALLSIRQTETTVEISDSTGTVVEAIAIGGVPGGPDDEGAPRPAGRWKGAGLEVEREGRRGARIRTYTLEDDGRLLVIRTAGRSGDADRGREMKRVYRREGQ